MVQDEDSRLRLNIGIYLLNCKVSHPRISIMLTHPTVRTLNLKMLLLPHA